MNGERERLRKMLAEALKQARRADFEAARGGLRWSRDFMKLGALWHAFRILEGYCRGAVADCFLNDSIPPLFRAHSATLFPDPDSLRIVAAINPPFYHDADGNEIPDFKGGVMLYGPTGAGKTRAAFLMLSRWVQLDEMRFRYYTGPALKRALADAARAGKAGQLIEEIVGDDSDVVIFVDDLSQARFTASFAENLFELIDRIHRERRLLVVTVQTTGPALVRKWCADDHQLTDTAEAIARRLRDYCVKVRFTKRCPDRPAEMA